jgi:hypothetical protein
MQLSGSVDMQFCFSVLFFVLLTALVTYWAISGRRPTATGQDEYAAQIEQLKKEEKGG